MTGISSRSFIGPSLFAQTLDIFHLAKQLQLRHVIDDFWLLFSQTFVSYCAISLWYISFAHTVSMARGPRKTENPRFLGGFLRVSDTGIEPATSSVSGKRATAAPIAHAY